MGLLGNNKELQFAVCGLLVYYCKSRKTKERSSFMGLGGDVVKEESIGGNRKFRV